MDASKHGTVSRNRLFFVADITVAFKIHDIGNTGFIQKEGVKKMITELLTESNLILSDDIIEAMIAKAWNLSNIILLCYLCKVFFGYFTGRRGGNAN